MRRITLGLIVAIPGLASCTRTAPSDAVLSADRATRRWPTTIALRSDAFADGATIPRGYTCDGQDVSPPLSWSGLPDGARSLALICEDPDAPGGTFTHWLLYGLPADVGALKQGVPRGGEAVVAEGRAPALQGKNDFGALGYGGPCPPGTHHYLFRLYALDAPPALPAGTDRARLLRAMKGHILAEGRLTGMYSR